MEEGKSSYRGIAWNRFGFLYAKQSAEAIVVVEYELRTDTAEGLTKQQRANAKSLRMPHGGLLALG